MRVTPFVVIFVPVCLIGTWWLLRDPGSKPIPSQPVPTAVGGAQATVGPPPEALVASQPATIQTPDNSPKPTSPGVTQEANWREALRGSDNPTDMLLLALQEGDVLQREALLGQALALDPYNPLLNYAVLEHCTAEMTSALCGPEYLDVLAALDANNGVVADFSAINAYRNGDFSGALASLNHASDAEFSDSFRWQHMSLLGDALIRQGRPIDAGLVTTAMSESLASSGARLGALFQMCQDQRTDSVWQDACAQRGLALSQSGKSWTSQDFGYGMAMSVVDHPDQLHQQLAELRVPQMQANQALSRELERQFDRKDWQLSQRQWHRFIDTYAQEGEQAALRFLVNSVGEE